MCKPPSGTIMAKFLGVLCVFHFILAVFGESDYYWRDYTGKIPKDAVVGGKDPNGDNIYIGQAYVKNEGLIPVPLKEGSKEVYAPNGGAKLIDRHIKILCGPSPQSFVWLASNATNLHVDLLNKTPVIGGHVDGLGSLYIGRINYEGSIQIGKVSGFQVGNAWFHWVTNYYQENGVNSYEVLTYDNEFSGGRARGKKYGYYVFKKTIWREYEGTIPPDAIGSKNVFIGQVYVHNEGLIVAEIFPGVQEVYAPINGIQKIESNIKILCGPQQSFYWLPVNHTHLHLQLINKKPVIGGHERGGVLFVGRITSEDRIKIGKVVAFLPENSKLFFNNDGSETGVEAFEILLYKKNAISLAFKD